MKETLINGGTYPNGDIALYCNFCRTYRYFEKNTKIFRCWDCGGSLKNINQNKSLRELEENAKRVLKNIDLNFKNWKIFLVLCAIIPAIIIIVMKINGWIN